MTKNGLKWSFYGILLYIAYDIFFTNIDMMGIERAIKDPRIDIWGCQEKNSPKSQTNFGAEVVIVLFYPTTHQTSKTSLKFAPSNMTV